MEGGVLEEGWSEADWERLAGLRSRFLASGGDEGGGWGSAWRDRRELELYDASFGRRIAWKWDAVLDELAARGWSPPGGHLHDFAAGTGVAARALLERHGPRWERVSVWDRSPLARELACERIAREHPSVRPEALAPDANERIDLLLASHVLGELDARGWDDLRGLLARSRAALLVEPGSRGPSRALGALREELRADFVPRAPCPHAGACGALAPGAEAHWCHFFARVPAEAFAERRWAMFARRLAIDLRSLPYAWLLVERRGADERAGESARESEHDRAGTLARLVGRARVEKGRARIFVCDARGLHERTLLEREHRALFKRLRAPLTGELVRIVTEGERVRSCESADAPLARDAT